VVVIFVAAAAAAAAAVLMESIRIMKMKTIRERGRRRWA